MCSTCQKDAIELDGSGEAALCANNREIREKCLKCAERPHQINACPSNYATYPRKWSREMIREWSQKNVSNLSLFGDKLEDDGHATDVTSNELFFMSDAFDVDILRSNDSISCKVHLDVGPKCNCTPVQDSDSIRLPEKIDKPYNTDHCAKMSTEEFYNTKQLRTVGGSTESTPRLLPDESIKKTSRQCSPEWPLHEDKFKMESIYKTSPDEHLLMNVATSSVRNPSPMLDGVQKKSEASCTDLRLQQIMGTFLESMKTSSIEEQQFYNLLREKIFHVPMSKLKEIIPPIGSEGEPMSKLKEIIPPISSENDDDRKIEVPTPVQRHASPEKPVAPTLIANCRRAYYNPPVETMPSPAPYPQFQIISLCNVNISKELLQTDIIDGTNSIPRRPVICPVTTCRQAIFVSDFARHIAVDHSTVPLEGIFPQQCKNFFFDPKLIHFGTNRCQMLLLVKNKIINFGHEKFKDFIPVLVMATKLRLLDICTNSHQPQSEEVQRGTQYVVMIWLTSILPPQLPIFFSLTVWTRSGTMPACHLVHSGRLYSVRDAQRPEAVRRSGQMLLLSNNQLELLTNGGRDMLELQITVH